MKRKSTIVWLAGCLCYGGVALAETSTAEELSSLPAVNQAIVVAQLPPAYPNRSSPPPSSRLFASSPSARCVVSDGCFPRPRLAVDTRTPETIPGDSIHLGEYGPLLLKFTGTRVKMRVRF